MSAPAIRLSSVVRTYPGEPPIRALDDVDLTIEHGEFVSIVGPSGSGKSTLLNVMGTLDRPTSGTVAIDGIETQTLKDRYLCGLRSRRLGFVFQGFHLLESQPIIDNVANGLLYQGIPRTVRHERARDALGLVGMADRASTRPPKLSGGQRQRVAIARAIIAKPALVLADEPTGNLDSRTSSDIMAVLRSLNEQVGTTVALITHDLNVAAYAARQIHVRDGRIERDDAKQSTSNHHESRISRAASNSNEGNV